MSQPEHSSDYFLGWVPAGINFEIDYTEIMGIINSVEEEAIIPSLNQVCFIGLVSFTEAFFKNYFASLINIYNPLALKLARNHRNINIDVADIINLGEGLSAKLGSLISEQFDFGTAANINSLYRNLLNITPFSKDEIVKYNEILRDRNLLVHHGGIYTNKYLRQKSNNSNETLRLYADSIVITKEQYIEFAEFILSVVHKTISASKSSLLRVIKEDGITITEIQQEAIDQLDSSIL